MQTGAVISRRPRTAGILLHPSSLPGPYGIGDLGPSARAWVDLLAHAGQTWWQVLPLNPPGAGDSPYSAFSAFAGNPLLISPDDLCSDRLLSKEETESWRLPPGRVDFPRVTANKTRLLACAWERFRTGAVPELRTEFESFATATNWLDDYALFMAIKEAMPDGVWNGWPSELARRQPAAFEQARRDRHDSVDRHRFGQFLFSRQLAALRRYAAARGVKLLGDMPIFVSGDSADVWASPQLFLLDANGIPSVVAGVPPDYFSATGQRWGNPHYNWEAMRREQFAWWVARVQATLTQVDAVRLDHFRGFEAYWEIPADSHTAQQGRWIEAPGQELFERLLAEFGQSGPLPFVAEDLGIITPEVDALRERFGLPGMRILQFAFGGAVEERFLPHTYESNVVVYTGTHDNDTTRGWFDSLTPTETANYLRYIPEALHQPVWALIRLGLASVADTAIVPLQDILNLGSEARMNVPGTPSGNWGWRVAEELLDRNAFDRLGELTEVYGRKQLISTSRAPTDAS